MYEAFNAICSVVMTYEFIKSIPLYVISIQRSKAFLSFQNLRKALPNNKQNIKIQKAGQNSLILFYVDFLSISNYTSFVLKVYLSSAACRNSIDATWHQGILSRWKRVNQLIA